MEENPQKIHRQIKIQDAVGTLPLEEYMNHLWLVISLEDTEEGANDKHIQGWIRSP